MSLLNTVHREKDGKKEPTRYYSKKQEDAIAKYLMDRETYSVVKDKYAYHMGFDKNTSIDEQMAILATVRGNTPKDAPVIDAILNARDVNIASVAKLKHYLYKSFQ